MSHEFQQHFLGRIRSIIDKYKIKGTIAVALSGGKDSTACFHALNKFNFKLLPFYIDVGIHGFSEKCEEMAEKISNELGYNLNVIRVRDYGIDINKAKKKCSVCGTVRRYLMNKFAFENGCDYIATGHNLDDIVTFAFNNLANVNILNFRGMKPFLEGNEKVKMVAKIKPLYYLKDDECLSYVKMNDLPYCRETCPYAKDAPTLEIKEWLNKIEKKRNGMLLNFAKSFSKIEEKMEKSEIRACNICGYPSYGRICKFCKLRRKYGKI
ncbi:MAG: TIGR00269 family protein [Thermoplasmata archaeon]|nr:TIGR00269 family protein [Thermoplasmata archaeon]